MQIVVFVLVHGWILLFAFYFVHIMLMLLKKMNENKNTSSMFDTFH